MPSLPRPAPRLTTEQTLSVTATGLKNILIEVPAGKIWKVRSVYVSGGGDGNTTTSSVGLFLNYMKKTQGSSTGSAFAFMQFFDFAVDIGGTAGIPLNLPYEDSALLENIPLLKSGDIIKALIVVSAYVSTETYALQIGFEEFDELGTGTEQF